MARLRGRGIGAGMALGTAAVVRVSGGVPFAPPPPEVNVRFTDKPEIVIVAEDYSVAVAMAQAITWGDVVGIVAGHGSEILVAGGLPPSASVPSVVGVTDLLERIGNDILLLVDASRDTVLIDPDPVAIAQYQSEHEQIAPKRRFFLDENHYPATSLDGRTVQVIATVRNWEDVEQALTAGADALYIVPESSNDLGLYMPGTVPLIPHMAEEGTLRRALYNLIELTSGKPLLLSGEHSLPLKPLLQAGSRADLTLVLPPNTEIEGLGWVELNRDFKVAEQDLIDQEETVGMVRLAAETAIPHGSAEESDALVLRLEAAGALRLVLHGGDNDFSTTLADLDRVVHSANTNSLPVFVDMVRCLPYAESSEQESKSIQMLVGTALSGLLLPPDRVEQTKQLLREWYFTACREALIAFLQEQHPE